MPRYRLLSAHYSEEDKWLPGDKENESFGRPGTEVGDGTEHKWTGPPSTEMVGLDAESEALVAEAHARRPQGIDPIDFLPMTMGPQMPSPEDLQTMANRQGFKLVKEDANVSPSPIVADVFGGGAKRSPAPR